MSARVQIEQKLSCTPEQAWLACAAPSGMRQWQADQVSGRVVAGGRLELKWPALGASIELDVVEVRRGERLVLESGRSRVTFELGPGFVRVEHQGIASSDELAGTDSAWRTSLALLAHYVERHRGRSRSVHWVVRRARTTPEAAAEFFSGKEALGAWLGRTDAAIGMPGSRYELRTLWGEPMTGRVLSRVPGRDLALSWAEQDDSALVLRTLPSPSASDERLIAACWSRWSGAPASKSSLHGLDAALDNLARLLDGAGSA